jgi:hypothetical protein
LKKAATPSASSGPEVLPAHTATVAVGVRQCLFGAVEGPEHGEAATDVGGQGGVGEYGRVLVREEIRVRLGGVDHVRAGDLSVQPLTDIALDESGLVGQFGRGERAGAGHRPVQAEADPQRGGQPGEGGGVVRGHALKEFHDAIFVRHVMNRSCRD